MTLNTVVVYNSSHWHIKKKKTTLTAERRSNIWYSQLSQYEGKNDQQNAKQTMKQQMM
jgi:hypothetical protein